ncbi:MAG: HEAT repeat domain-containing protein [Gemmatimonadales bacterium]
MTTRRVVVFIGVLAAATFTAAAARTMAHERETPQGIAGDSSRAGPDSARVAKLLDALGRTDRLVCDLVADQLGNFWWDGDRYGLGAFADATRASRAAKDSLSGQVRDPRAIVLLSSNLRADDPCVRRVAAKMLGHSSAKTGEIARLLDDPAPRVREAAAYALGNGERNEARAVLEKHLGGGDGALGAMSAWALGEIHDSASAPALTRALGAASAEVRWSAAGALGELNDLRKAPDALVRAAGSTDARLQKLAARALAEIHDPATVDALIGLLANADREVRLHAVEALGEIRSSKASPGLVRALKDPDAKIRKAAAEALGELKDSR